MKSRLCINCVMDSTDSAIVFDANGICDHCSTFYSDIEPKWQSALENEAQVKQIAERIRHQGRDKEFDCIIGMSGGIDSSYLTYLAKEKLGLRPLVFHVDAGWNSQEAVNNIEQIVKQLDLELYTKVINWNEMRDLQLAYFKSGVPHIDTPQDHAFFATMYQFAQEHNVKYILTGGNYSTECIRNPIEWMYYQTDSVQLRDIHKKFGTIPLKSFPITNILWHKIYLPYVLGLKTLRPLDYLPYNKQEATDFLVEKFGYQKYEQKHFESVFTRFYESYWLPQRFGFDTRKVQYSSLILTGQMSREDAIEKLKAPAFNEATIEADLDYVAMKLGITSEDLDNYFRLPLKSYKDYRSQSVIYDMGARVMKRIGLEKGGKR